MIDYQDFLRNHQFPEWEIGHPYSQRLQQLNRIKNPTYSTYKRGIEHSNPDLLRNRTYKTK